jgi:galactokinase
MTASFTDRLVAAGLSPAQASFKTNIFRSTARALAQRVPDSAGPWLWWYVPGRIEVLGKHTDYAGGRSLLCAVERGFCLTAVARADDRLRIVDVITGQETQLTLYEQLPEMQRWRNYPATVARRLARNFPAGLGSGSGSGPNGKGLRGADIAFASDLPRSSGLSSSSALIIAIFSVLADVNALEERDEYRANIPDLDALASYLGCIENGKTFGTLAGDRGVGTHGGSQDHLAIVGSEAGRIASCRFSPVRRERFLPLADEYTFVIASSGVSAAKTGRALEAYNRAALGVSTILRLWRRSTMREDLTLFEALASEADALARLRDIIRRDASSLHGGGAGVSAGAGSGSSNGANGSKGSNGSSGHHDSGAMGAGARGFTADELIARLDQFHLETFELIPAATEALAAGDFTAFGALVDRSQSAAERGLGNQIPETIALARIARESGALAASAFGAGFGGSVWALVRAAEADMFLSTWRDRYLADFPARKDRSEFFLSRPGPGRLRL